MRILHAVDTLAVGGLQNGLANLVARLDTARYEHVLCAMRPVNGSTTQVFPEGRVRVVKAAGSPPGVRALMRTIRETKPDIVHTRNWGTAEALIAAKAVGGCGVVHSEHGIDFDSTEHEPRRRRFLRRVAFELADRSLTVSYQLRELHAKRTGFPASRITVIHNGVDTERFAPDAAARLRTRAELGIGPEEFCAGTVGNLIPVKDHRTLLEAMKVFAAQRSDWRLLIVGDGPELGALEAMTGERGWKDRVLFTGKSTRVPELLNAMDVYVSSSLTEGISNSILEAMATELPVAATATGGNPELAVKGESGLFFAVGDARHLAEHLLALRDRVELRRRLGSEALRRVRSQFSIGSMVRKYDEVYASLRRAGADKRLAARA